MSTIQNDIFPRILERTNLIQRMDNHHLKLDFLHEFSIPELNACCDRITAHFPDFNSTDQNLQRELIQNKSFAAYLSRLFPLIPEEETEKSQSIRRLYGLVRICQSSQIDITVYPVEALAESLSLDLRTAELTLVFLKYFAPMQLDDTSRQTVTVNLNRCCEVSLDLSDSQKKLLLEPFVSSRALFSSGPFHEICDLLNNSPALQDIIQMLHETEVDEALGIEEYKLFSQSTAERYRLLCSISNQMDAEAMGMFLAFWQKGCCALTELLGLERWITAHPGQDWNILFATYSGYINLLYGARFQKIDLSAVSSDQEEILIYAIVHNKKHFIRMVDEHTELFFSISRESVIFQPDLYRKHFNLNELTERDLRDCVWMTRQKLKAENLLSDRHYTFPELKALYNTSRVYILLYHALRSDSQDYRLRVLHQLRKRNMLSSDTITEDGILALAQCLDRKPLYSWLQEDFGHIKDLTATDTLKMLVHLEQLCHLVFSMGNRKDAVLALQNLDILERFNSMDDLKMNIVQVDQDWHYLAEVMKLNSDFLELHWDNIVAFICENGAYIAETYLKSLELPQQEAFLRVVKAELMGQLEDLKYFEDDLQREIDFPMTDQTKASWRENLKIEQNGLEVGEYDDFFSTMLLGVQPYPTCLNYSMGVYRWCLLSAFDSNKKVLYATLNGRIVGRAFLRLTKGRLTGTGATEQRFTFVDLEDVEGSRHSPVSGQEYLTLFLERLYISHVGPETEKQIKRGFIELTRRKSEELGAVLVLSIDYCGECGADFAQTHFDIYISKSKAGIQYLDSLDGPATATTEGSYKANTFLIRKIT